MFGNLLIEEFNIPSCDQSIDIQMKLFGDVEGIDPDGACRAQ
jgi:hypothetical protein